MNSTKRSTTSFDEITGDSGEFKRKPTAFHNRVSADGSTEFPAEAGRYHLYVSYACPWASRCLLFRALKGLQDAIPVHTVAPRWGDVSNDEERQRLPESERPRGWIFSDQDQGGVPCDDPLYGSRSMRELYERSDPEYCGKYTVPVLWDSKTHKIVNNESSEIIAMFNKEFDAFAEHPKVDLRPTELGDQIEQLNNWMYNSINNGVYRCGFARKQAAYEQAFHELFQALDEAEEKLSRSRFLCGNRLTESDLRLFVTLVRFDPVYVGHFKCNKKRIIDYPNLWGYLRDVYQQPGVKETVNMYHIKQHYHGSHPTVNPFGIVPLGPDIDFETPHGRERMQ